MKPFLLFPFIHSFILILPFLEYHGINLWPFPHNRPSNVRVQWGEQAATKPSCFRLKTQSFLNELKMIAFPESSSLWVPSPCTWSMKYEAKIPGAVLQNQSAQSWLWQTATTSIDLFALFISMHSKIMLLFGVIILRVQTELTVNKNPSGFFSWIPITPGLLQSEHAKI